MRYTGGLTGGSWLTALTSDLGDGRFDGAWLVRNFEQLDPEAFAHNVECAALKGRWLVHQDRPQEAHNVYTRAFERNPDSYYLADLLGQVCLELGDQDSARKAYARALEIIERLPEQNLWIEATAATAAVVTGHQAKALEHLRRAQALQPSQENLDAIERAIGGPAEGDHLVGPRVGLHVDGAGGGRAVRR